MLHLFLETGVVDYSILKFGTILPKSQKLLPEDFTVPLGHSSANSEEKIL